MCMLVCVCVHTCMSVFVHACAHMGEYGCVLMCECVCLCVNVCTLVCEWVCVCVCLSECSFAWMLWHVCGDQRTALVLFLTCDLVDHCCIYQAGELMSFWGGALELQKCAVTSSFYVSSEDSHSGPHTAWHSVSTEPSLQDPKVPV